MVREKERPGSKDDRRGRDAERECDLDDASEEDFVVGEEKLPSGLWRPPDVILFKAPTMNECEEARGLRSFAFQKDSNNQTRNTSN